jgi:hypothetical protein
VRAPEQGRQASEVDAKSATTPHTTPGWAPDVPAVDVACILGSGCLAPRMHLCTVPGKCKSSVQQRNMSQASAVENVQIQG